MDLRAAAQLKNLKNSLKVKAVKTCLSVSDIRNKEDVGVDISWGSVDITRVLWAYTVWHDDHETILIQINI